MMSKSARAFKRTEQLTLTNGEMVEVRKPDLQKLALNAKDGEIPSFLRSQIINALNGIAAPVDEKQVDLQINIDNAHEYVAFLEMVTRAALVWPVIKVDPTDADYDNGFIAIGDLTLADLLQVATWAMPKESQAVSSFRGEQSAIMETASDLQGIQPATVNGSRH